MATTAAPRDEWGPRLADFLTKALQARGVTVNAFTDRTPGLAGSDVTRWRSGTEPTILKFRAVADGLDLPFVDVLIAGGVMTAAEANRAPVDIVTPSLEVALATDPNVTDWERERIRDFVDALRAVRTGQAESVSVRGGRKQTRRPRA